MSTRKAATKARKPAKRAARSARPAKPDLQVPKGWSLDKGGKSISLEMRTKDFLEAVDVITALAPIAEKLEHHPDLHLEKWNHLRITTWSHDVGGLTERDVALATKVNEELAARGWTART